MERILKNILWRPQEAFQPEALKGTFFQSLATYFIASLIAAMITAPHVHRLPFLSKLPWIGESAHLVSFAFYVQGFFFVCIHMWLITILVKRQGQRVDTKMLITGALWTASVLIPIGAILTAFLHLGIVLITLPYRLWLMTVCIRSLTGLSTKSSFWVYVLSTLILCLIGGIVLFGVVHSGHSL